MSETEPVRSGAILREFAAYLRRPRLTAPTGLRAAGAWRHWALLVVLQIAVLLGLLAPLIGYWQSRFGLPLPDAFGQMPAEWLIPIAVLAAPVIEECFFRGWLTGRPRALWLLVCALAGGALLYASASGMDSLTASAALAALILAAIAGWAILRRRAAAPWFAAAFPALFYLSVIAFGLVHIVNYPSFSMLALPMVLPQLWAGLVLGFIRMRIGLIASILAHATSNAAALSLAMLAS
jgi:membrane protease YdiL (CAAX protease family)